MNKKKIEDITKTNRVCYPTEPYVVDFIAGDGHRDAAGGIYGTSVQDFALEIQREFAEKNGLKLRGFIDGEEL